MLPLPDEIAQCCLWFDGPDRRALSAEWGEIALPPEVSAAAERRKREFVAGRLCARRAIGAVAPERAREVVAIGAAREPVWPRGLVGSLTHADGLAVAIVGRSADFRGVGVDVERVLDVATAADIAAQIATPDELTSLARSTALAPEMIVTLVFSAKESLFKCLHPIARRWFGFLDARVVALDMAAHSFTIELLATISIEFARRSRFAGSVCVAADRVYTALLLRAADASSA